MQRLLPMLILMLTTWSLPANSEELPLPNGSDAPDFTLTDVYGNTHNLYTYLDQGKTVVLDFFAVWCGPCWNYHQTHILENYYNLYGPGGTNEVVVLSIEADFSTPASAIFGGPGSIGNWTSGISYPIMDDGTGQVASSYQISYFPTLYVVCPNKKVYEVGQAPLSGWENWKQSCSLSESTVSNDILCFGETTGSIDLTATGGLGGLSFQWNSGATSEDLNNLAAGTYYCTITEGQGHTVETGPIQISSPPQLVGQTQSTFDVSCFGDSDGIAAISATGGVPGYQFQWDNGTSGPIAMGLPGGVHHATITDANGCTQTHSVVINSPAPIAVQVQSTPENCGQADGTLLLATTGGTYPYQYDIGTGPTGIPFFQNLTAGSYVALIIDAAGCEEIVEVVLEAAAAPVSDPGQDQVIDCINTSVFLDGSGSSAGPAFSYIWTASDGTILNNPNEMVVEVNAPDTYQLEVIDNSNGCNSFSSVVITEDIALPVSDAGPDMEITCLSTEVIPDASGSSQGATFAYSWTTVDGWILQGENTLTPVFGGPGIYYLDVTSTQNGCTTSSVVTVAENLVPPVADAGPAQQLDCNNALAILDASSSNTSPDMVATWTTPDGHIVTSPDDWIVEVDAPGAYTLTVLDTSNGCMDTDQVLVDQDLNAPVADAGPSMELNCLNSTVDLDGTSSEAGSGIDYAWMTSDGQIDSGETSMTPTVSAPGTYELTVTNNSNGCVSTAMVIVTELAPVEASVDAVTDALCAEDASGAATVSGSGGVSSYTYDWSNGASGATVDGLLAGTYEVTVNDQIGCSDIVTVVVGEPDVIVVNATSTDETTNDANDGTASASPSGGVGGYQYLWSTGETSPSISGLEPGLYTVDITDNNGCTISQSVTVNSFSCQLAADSDAAATTCFGASDGVAAIILENEEGPISFDWSTGDTSAEVTDLEAGTYTVTVQDANNCQLVVEVEVAQPSLVELEVIGSETVDCAGNATGMANLEATGGVGGYTYEWPDGSTGPVQSQLNAGVYSVTATDANGCTALLDVLITEPDPLIASIDVLHESSNDSEDGMANVTPAGGVADYTYNWSTGDIGPSVEGLAPGSYEVTVIDANGCSIIMGFEIDPFECTGFTVFPDSSPVSCFGDADGVAMVEAEDPEGDYAYTWSTGDDGAQLEELEAGIYQVTITDAFNCLEVIEVEVEEPALLEVQLLEQLDIECEGQSTGSAMVEGVGGNGNYSYEWSTGVSGPQDDQLSAGMHQVSITDALGCTAVLDIEIQEESDNTFPTVLTQEVTISLNTNGTAFLSPDQIDAGSFDNCGIADMQLSQTIFNCDHLGENIITFTVTDINGNMSEAEGVVQVIDEEAPVIQCPASITTQDCASPVNYDFPTAFDNCSIASLELTSGIGNGGIFPEGTTEEVYTVVDMAGNATSCSFTVTVENTLDGAVVSMATCPDVAEGTASATSTGGTPDYSYEWDNGADTPTIENLDAGIYTVMVTDALGCTNEMQVEVEAWPGVEMEVEQILNEQGSGQNGAIQIALTSGIAPFIYQWTDEDGMLVGSSQNLTNISAGMYTCLIIDANGCEFLSDPIQVDNITSAHAIPSLTHLQLFPNPAHAEIFIRLQTLRSEPLQVQVMDTRGVEVAFLELESNLEHQARLDVSDWPSGMYMMVLRGDSYSSVERIVVK